MIRNIPEYQVYAEQYRILLLARFLWLLGIIAYFSCRLTLLSRLNWLNTTNINLFYGCDSFTGNISIDHGLASDLNDTLSLDNLAFVYGSIFLGGGSNFGEISLASLTSINGSLDFSGISSDYDRLSRTPIRQQSCHIKYPDEQYEQHTSRYQSTPKYYYPHHVK